MKKKNKYRMILMWANLFKSIPKETVRSMPDLLKAQIYNHLVSKLWKILMIKWKSLSLNHPKTLLFQSINASNILGKFKSCRLGINGTAQNAKIISRLISSLAFIKRLRYWFYIWRDSSKKEWWENKKTNRKFSSHLN